MSPKTPQPNLVIR
uniref:Uncharacterized protein n=1 Tax=Anguilla anguilla TaxID=7936 RepID=A0A0E9SDT5_ANGAN